MLFQKAINFFLFIRLTRGKYLFTSNDCLSYSEMPDLKNQINTKIIFFGVLTWHKTTQGFNDKKERRKAHVKINKKNNKHNLNKRKKILLEI
jgi:hypothetical protein